MKYRNVKTGAIINVNSFLHGNWELVGEPQTEKPVVAEPIPEEGKKTRKPAIKKTKK